MSETLAELSQRALSLAPSEREQLAEDILISLQTEFDPEIEEAWEQEIAKRVGEIDSGSAKLIPAAQVFAEARRLLGR